MLEMHGALVCLVLWSLWVAWNHLKETVQKALSHTRAVDDGVPVSYRTAWIGLGLGTIGVGGWMVSSGLGFWAMVGQLILMFICYFGIVKYAAATGFTFLRPVGGKGVEAIHSIIGHPIFRPAHNRC